MIQSTHFDLSRSGACGSCGGRNCHPKNRYTEDPNVGDVVLHTKPRDGSVLNRIHRRSVEGRIEQALVLLPRTEQLENVPHPIRKIAPVGGPAVARVYAVGMEDAQKAKKLGVLE